MTIHDADGVPMGSLEGVKPQTIQTVLKRLLADVDDNMEFIGSTWNSKEHASSSVDRSLAKALQALYEAVRKEVLSVKNPWTNKIIGDEDMPRSKYLRLKAQQVGFEKCRAVVLTNLSLLFGVADVGGLERHSDEKQA